MSLDPKEFVGKARKRSTGAILGFIERQSWYGGLTVNQKRELRDKVLSAEGAYHDVVLDVINTLDGGGGVHNGQAIELLQEIHGLLQERPLTETLDGRSS